MCISLKDRYGHLIFSWNLERIMTATSHDDDRYLIIPACSVDDE